MPRFKYTGRDRKGKKSGVVTATSKRDALLRLREKGMRVTEIDQVPETFFTKDISIGNPVKLQDFVIYLRQFATLLRAGVPIVDATRILAEQTDSKPLNKALLDIELDLREGKPFSVAAERHPKIFTNMFTSMIKAGEAGGNMDDTLERLATHFEKQHETKQKIVSALTYPVVVAVIAVFVVIFLLVSVVPTFVDMFQDFGGELPAITVFVLGASKFMQGFWWIIILFIFAVAFALVALRKNKNTKYYLDLFALKTPVFGSLMQKAAIARMSRTLSSLFASSVPILQSLAIVEKVVENEVITRVIRNARDSLEKGQSLTEPMQKSWVFPPLVTQMIAIGEQSGSLDSMLGKVADFYEQEVDIMTDRLKSMIEPLMIIILAVFVGTIVISILVPMFEIFQHVG